MIHLTISFDHSGIEDYDKNVVFVRNFSISNTRRNKGNLTTLKSSKLN